MGRQTCNYLAFVRSFLISSSDISEEAHLGQDLIYWFFRPVGAAVKATEIGRAMLEVTARGSSFENGAKISTSGIVGFSDAYDRRHSSVTPGNQKD